MSTPTEKFIIEFKEVNKFYSKIKVLNELSFNIKNNELVALVGNNGCGKTTALKLICNMCSYENGEVLVYGKKIRKRTHDYKKKMGIVFGISSLIPELTPKSYINFVGEFQFMSKATINERFNELMELFEFEEFEKTTISKLSSGNKMKVAISAALIHNPNLLILDEPFTNLDIRTIEVLKNIIKSLKGNKTIVLTSHTLDHLVDFSDRFLIMNQGAIVNSLIPEKLNPSEIKETIKKYLDKENKDIKNVRWLRNETNSKKNIE